MKKILVFAFVLLVLPVLAFSADMTQGGWASYDRQNMKVGTFTVTADGSGNVADFYFEDLSGIKGYYLLSVEMYSATDDAFATIIKSALGTTLFSHTTTAATSGEIRNATDRWPIYAISGVGPYMDVTGLTATESATIVVTLVR